MGLEDVCSCKCGVESPDVKFTKSRLICTFITINLIAAALGLNELASSNQGEVILGRTSLIQSQTVKNIPFGDSTIAEAVLIQNYDFGDDDVCSRVSDSNLSISKAECESMRSTSVVWLGLGITAILLLFVTFIFLLRIECRKLCSKCMRQICIALLSTSLLLVLISWIILITSPISDNFSAFGTSFWITVAASVLNLVVVTLSIVEYQKVGGGAASAAK
eukprot:76174_1